MRLDTLYKRTRTGAIQQWSIRTEGAVIIKEAGQLGGKLTPHSETCKGKNIGKSNETTPEQQAESQARSDWKKKRDEGYKSLEDLKIVETSAAAVDPNLTHRAWFEANGSPSAKAGSLEEVLEIALPQFNTDANGNVKPMLAKDYNPKKVQLPCYIQPKLDGVRCLMIVEFNMVSQITFLSRSGKPYTTLQHIAADVLDTHAAGQLKNDSFILDGEVYLDDISFQEITRLVKKERESAIKLHFRAYDIVSDAPQHERIGRVHKLVESINSPYIHTVPTQQINTLEEVKMFHDAFVASGYEGAILRAIAGTYDQGQRSSHLLKVKEFDEEEFVIIGGKIFKEPINSDKQFLVVTPAEVDSFTFTCLTADGGAFDVKPKGSREHREQLIHGVFDQSVIGKKLTVKYFGWTEDKLPRFPIGKAIRDYE
jgi:ATP-dependent DNA ligase